MRRTNRFVVRPLTDEDERLLRELLDASASLWNDARSQVDGTARAPQVGQSRMAFYQRRPKRSRVKSQRGAHEPKYQ